MKHDTPARRADLAENLCLSIDLKRLRGLQRELLRSTGEKREKLNADFVGLLARSQAAVAECRAKLPKPEFQSDLPVNERRADIADLIVKNQVVIVCGETGSGKTTQLPKICLDLGLGARGLIGHTQPRRLAARSVATRLAQELKTQVGAGVGVKIRFQDRSSPESWVKLMTDGILLAESQSDPYLNAYEAIIIDEAHERSLNIDFLLGYLKQLLAKRPDLKVIITSATIDAERFSQHFSLHGKPAPVIEVSGRLYPVEVRYRPVEDLEKKDDERDLYDAIVDAADEVARLGSGDILVFLPGEREIREAAEALRKHALARPGLSSAHAPEILPLFSRLSAGDQDRIFKPSGGQRRIVLATNVAETSLTVPGIRYVIDTGLARVKRYSYRNKVEQLQIEKVSQAAARQRAGRCGRVAAGVCIRLYDELDFNARSPFTDPEILRSSLAGVILRMKSLRLTDVESFPFIEPPPAKAIADGYALLQELGALDDDNVLTPIGASLAKLPLDPRIGRMLVAARDLGCLKEVMVIAAGLSAQDPRERPQERQQAADEKHKLFADEKSEFLGWWKLWNWFQNAVEHKKSNKQLVDNCHAHFLSYLRMREWREVHGQLHAMVTELGWKESDLPGTYDAIHQALLSGLLGNLGCKADESGFYLGARGIRYLIHPSSPLQKKAGKWIMAAEITETTRLFGRCVARIEPDWLEKVGAHLIKRQYFDAHWEKKSMQVSGWERTTLYGVVINPKRRIHYGPMAPAEGREIFIRQGLVSEEIDEAFAKRWPFFQHNQRLIREIEHLEHKQRRQDVLVDDELIFAFYDSIIPEGIHNGATFDHWRKEAEQENAKLLYLSKDDLMRHSAAGVTTEAFPHHLKVGGVDYSLSYHFEPGSPRDGVTLTLPLAQLNQIPVLRMEWLVPGLLKEKLVQLIKTLPQKIRAKVVPVPEFVEEFLSTVAGNEKKMNQGLITPLIDHILEARGLNARGWAVTPDSFRPDALPAHFSMNYKLIDEHGRQLDMNRSLVALRAEWGKQAKDEFAELHETPSEFTKLTDWTFGELPELMEVPVAGQTVLGYPGLTDDGESVSLKVFDSAEEAAAAHRAGLLRLFMLQFRDQVKYFDKNIPGLSQMAMQYMALGSADDLKSQIVALTFERACLTEPLPTTPDAFKRRCGDSKARLGLIMQEVCRLVGTVLTEWQTVIKKLPAFKAHAAAVADIEAQLKRLMGKNFLIDTPFERLQHYPRYFKACVVRLDKLKANPGRDAQLMVEYAPLWTNYERRAIQLAKLGALDPQVEQFRWLLEELRVGLFAQELRTPVPVSSKRLQKQWEGIKNG
ncbi:MAG: ATP-dependent RNA helicase HrpA [Gammaproteobacteria bacterium]|nr:ATP-dependent RNA helicase HrpA [Gammaproteobacteria bacterium]MBU1601122.1 ATP-dependent RNA helicase HrpA [Gammaproteobacteria bacterium]MBU2434481.1 ATP-dependent RNA helicase HrpA [Gammaproteobacteria bacterium]MBU2450885.1 ATP-dependent RNA helicase HrpA [Gammaproteobacteria bacterium]